MAVFEITLYGNPILKKKCETVTDFKALAPLVNNMLDTMYEEEGIGLAANQIGIDLHLLVIDVSHIEDTDGHLVITNGEIINRTSDLNMEEGCLSLPGIRFDVKRPEEITLRYQTISGATKVEEFNGMLARVIQHEIDHLNGVLMIDRVSPLVKMQFNQELKEIEKLGKKQSPKT